MTFRDYVIQSGKSRQRLIDEIGCSQGYFSLLENGHRKVGKEYLAPASAALGVSARDLRPDLASLLGDAPLSEAS
jgi:transcriptional regulator with XRE-family HTH domain